MPLTNAFSMSNVFIFKESCVQYMMIVEVRNVFYCYFVSRQFSHNSRSEVLEGRSDFLFSCLLRSPQGDSSVARQIVPC